MAFWPTLAAVRLAPGILICQQSRALQAFANYPAAHCSETFAVEAIMLVIFHGSGKSEALIIIMVVKWVFLSAILELSI